MGLALQGIQTETEHAAYFCGPFYFPGINFPFSFFAFLGFPLFSTNQAKKIFFDGVLIPARFNPGVSAGFHGGCTGPTFELVHVSIVHCVLLLMTGGSQSKDDFAAKLQRLISWVMRELMLNRFAGCISSSLKAVKHVHR